jgi:hypothetical protein
MVTRHCLVFEDASKLVEVTDTSKRIALSNSE